VEVKRLNLDKASAHQPKKKQYTVLKQCVVVQGAVIVLPLFAFMRSSANWEQTDAFIPERFLEKNAETARKLGPDSRVAPFRTQDPAGDADAQEAGTNLDAAMADR
jgi:cytochrome P450